MGNDKKNKQYTVALGLIKSVGSRTYQRLYDHFGTVEEVFRVPMSYFRRHRPISWRVAETIIHKREQLLDQAADLLERHEKLGISVIPYDDARYPKRLRQIYNAPLVLYTQGALNLNQERLVAIVGTRKATRYGLDMVRQLVADLRPYEPVIVSGLAYGCDIVAHEAAMSNGLPTVGVIAGGLDRVYPDMHRKEAAAIQKKGCLVGEHVLGTRPERHFFPIRNRIIAGLVDVLVVVEAGVKSGAIITAKYANDFSREVFAVPGSVHSAMSVGCHDLIRTHQAHILTDVRELVYMLQWDKMQKKKPLLQAKNDDNISSEEKVVLAALGSASSMSLEALGKVTGLGVTRLSFLTLQLELKGLIVLLPGNRCRVRGSTR